MLAGIAAAPVAGLPAVIDVVGMDDPIFAAIAEIKRLEELSCDLHEALENAEHEAAKTYGKRPWSLIAWRNYLAIGGYEIERARDEFLRYDDADPAKIEVEYQDAKRRELEAERAQLEWDERAGLTAGRREDESLADRIEAAYRHLAATAPSTPAAAASFLDFIADDMQDGSCGWHIEAIVTIANALKSWPASAVPIGSRSHEQHYRACGHARPSARQDFPPC
ncbi:MAG: hypothetical protein U1E25_10875 [Methylocystis sp.]